jgi:FkbM family methyltransferase
MNLKGDKQEIVDKRNNILFSISHQMAGTLAKIPVRGSLLLGQMMSHLLLGKAKSPTLIKTRYDFDMLISPHLDNGVDRTLFLTGTTERGALHVMKQYLSLYPRANVFDVGANIGLMSLFASRLLPLGTVFAFEPVYETFQRLVFNIDLNAAKNVKVFNFALGSEAAYRAIYVNSSHLGMSSFLQCENPAESSQNVKIMTIDSIIEDKLSKVDFIKIDVEGWELEVLKGASQLLGKEDAPALMFEYCQGRSMPHGNEHDLWNFIRKINDYKIFILKDGEYRIGRLSEINHYESLPAFANLFCFLPRHLRTMPQDLFSKV